jgi:archaellum component FlaC
VVVTLEELLGRNHPAVGFVENLARTGNYAAANAIVLGKAVGVRLIRPLQAEVQLIKEELGEIGRALRSGGFAIRHINEKTIIHFGDARLTHILDSLARRVGKDPTTASEALGKAIERVTAIVRANLTRGALRDEFMGEVANRLRQIKEFMEATSKGAIVSLDHPVIKQLIDFLGPESERVIREVFNAKGMIDRDAVNEIIGRLKPIIQRRVNEEIEAARYIVALRHHADEVVREFARELGIDRRVSEIEGEVKGLGDFVRRVTMSTLPMPRERITNPELLGEFREVGGGRVVLREPLNMDVRIDLQTPKEILNDPELSLLLTAWLVNYLADRWHGWFVRSPGDAIYYTSLYKALTPEAEVLAILFASGIDPARLDWGGLLDEKERIEEGMDGVKAQLREAKDEEERAKLREELNELRERHKEVLRALFHWANAFNAFLSTLPSEERERIYENLPKKLRDLVDVARDPRDVYEAYVKNVARKIEGMKRRLGRAGGEGEEEGGWVRIDDVAEMRELIRNRLPRLDALIEPVRVELVDAITERVGEVISESGNDQPARAMLEQALNELRGGDLDNAVRQLRNAIENLRQVTREGEELARDAGKLDTLVKQLEALNALMRLARG